MKVHIISMKIYIASSWKNQHAVEMMTDLLENKGHTVFSFVRASTDVDEAVRNGETDSFDDWIAGPDGRAKFDYDLTSATGANLVIYIGPSGTDAWAEVGAAWARGVPVLGLWAKGEPAGLMRRMVTWFSDYKKLLTQVDIAAAGWH